MGGVIYPPHPLSLGWNRDKYVSRGSGPAVDAKVLQHLEEKGRGLDGLHRAGSQGPGSQSGSSDSGACG